MKRYFCACTLLLFLVLTACSFSGCATAGSGLTRDITLKTTPEKTQVTVLDENGREIDSFTTPGFAKIPPSLEYRSIIVSAPGYRSEEISINKNINPFLLGNCCYGGLFGIGIDLLTGAAVSYQSPIEVRLTPLPATDISPITEQTDAATAFSHEPQQAPPSLPPTEQPGETRRPSNLYRLGFGIGYETIIIQESSVRDTGLDSYNNLLITLGGMNLADDVLLMDLHLLYSYTSYTYKVPSIAQICYDDGTCSIAQTKLDLKTIQQGPGFEMNFLFNLPFNAQSEYSAKHSITPSWYVGLGSRLMMYWVTQELPDWEVDVARTNDDPVFPGQTYESTNYGLFGHLMTGIDFEYVRLEGFGGYAFIPAEVGEFTSDSAEGDTVESNGNTVNLGGLYFGGRLMLALPIY